MGEGSRERSASCLSLEGSKLSSFLVSKPHLPDSFPKRHKAAESFQSKDQHRFLEQHQSVTNLIHTGAALMEP